MEGEERVCDQVGPSSALPACSRSPAAAWHDPQSSPYSQSTSVTSSVFPFPPTEWIWGSPFSPEMFLGPSRVAALSQDISRAAVVGKSAQATQGPPVAAVRVVTTSLLNPGYLSRCGIVYSLLPLPPWPKTPRKSQSFPICSEPRCSPLPPVLKSKLGQTP